MYPARRNPQCSCCACSSKEMHVLQVSAVSHKTNTTVSCRLGAFTEGTAQVILYDTPGVVGRE